MHEAVLVPGTTVAPQSALAMPGPAESNASAIDAVGVEGRPADAKVGPGGLRLMLIGGLLIVPIGAVIAGLWLGWAAAFAVLGFGLIAAMLNPVAAATLQRAGDRRRVLQTTGETNDIHKKA